MKYHQNHMGVSSKLDRDGRNDKITVKCNSVVNSNRFNEFISPPLLAKGSTNLMQTD